MWCNVIQSMQFYQLVLRLLVDESMKPTYHLILLSILPFQNICCMDTYCNTSLGESFVVWVFAIHWYTLVYIIQWYSWISQLYGLSWGFSSYFVIDYSTNLTHIRKARVFKMINVAHHASIFWKRWVIQANNLIFLS